MKNTNNYKTIDTIKKNNTIQFTTNNSKALTSRYTALALRMRSIGVSAALGLDASRIGFKFLGDKHTNYKKYY